MQKRKKQFLEVFREVKNISTACKMIGISRTAYYKWIKKDDKFKSEVDKISEEAIEFVENKLMERIESGDLGAIIFFLKTKGKHRGWSEKIEATSNNQLPIINIIGV